MAKIPQKVINRFKSEVKNYKKILKKADSQDINEADTVVIVRDIICNVFGYDQYSEITSEYVIKQQYCDIAVKVSNSIKFLIEVKAIGKKLTQNFLNQTVNYGLQIKPPIDWIILTNGILWQVYKLKISNKAIDADPVTTIDFLNLNVNDEKVQQELFMLAKEGLGKNVINEYYDYIKVVNKLQIGAIIMGDAVTDKIRKEMKVISPGIKIDNSEIKDIIQSEVLKREIVEGDEIQEYVNIYKKGTKKKMKK